MTTSWEALVWVFQLSVCESFFEVLLTSRLHTTQHLAGLDVARQITHVCGASRQSASHVIGECMPWSHSSSPLMHGFLHAQLSVHQYMHCSTVACTRWWFLGRLDVCEPSR